MNSLPIIRIKIEHMKQSILAALSEREVQMDAYVSDAITRYATPENLARVIDAEVEHAINSAIKDATTSYFKYGEGRKFIVESVAKRLGDSA